MQSAQNDQKIKTTVKKNENFGILHSGN